MCAVVDQIAVFKRVLILITVSADLLDDDDADNDLDTQDTHNSSSAESPLLSNNKDKQSVKHVTMDLTGLSDCLEATEESVKNDVTPTSPTCSSPLLGQHNKSDQSHSENS